METALYFPHIRVPETSWFAQVLLYWDRTATIVPYSMETDTGALGRHMTELRRARLLDFIYPDEQLFRHDEAFTANFLTLVRAHALADAPRPRRWTSLHADKLDWGLFDQLRGLGLATVADDTGTQARWNLEERTAGLYMAYLASAISGVRGDTYPVTDQAGSIATLTPSAGDVTARLRDLRYAAITEALPAPSAALPASELRAFKDEHEGRLRRLRHELDRRLADLAMIEDAPLREAKAAGVLDELRDEVAALREQMERRRWPRVAMLGLGGVVGAALASVSGVTTAGGTLALGLAVAGGAVSVTQATYQAVEVFRQPRFNQRAPLAYAALAAKL